MKWLMDDALGRPTIPDTATRGQHEAARVSLASLLWGLRAPHLGQGSSQQGLSCPSSFKSVPTLS